MVVAVAAPCSRDSCCSELFFWVMILEGFGEVICIYTYIHICMVPPLPNARTWVEDSTCICLQITTVFCDSNGL